jgi:hypothetical protein
VTRFDVGDDAGLCRDCGAVLHVYDVVGACALCECDCGHEISIPRERGSQQQTLTPEQRGDYDF